MPPLIPNKRCFSEEALGICQRNGAGPFGQMVEADLHDVDDARKLSGIFVGAVKSCARGRCQSFKAGSGITALFHPV